MRIALSIVAIAGLATAAGAHPRYRGPAPRNDGNSYWLDYKTDISEAKRELRNDLDGASDDEDVRDAWEEYRHEIADAKRDFRKEMRERGYSVGTVSIED